MKKICSVVAAVAIVAAVFVAPARAATISLYGTDGWSDATLDYSYSFASGLWTYTYTFTDPGGDDQRAISHGIVQVSNDFTADNIKDGTTAGTLGTYSGADSSNPGMPFEIKGIKFDTSGDPTTATFTIVTDRQPVWGNFYAKDGVFNPGSIDVYAYNLGFAYNPLSACYGTLLSVNAACTGYVPVPDTVGGGGGAGQTIPEPATLGLFGLALAFGASRLRRRQ